MDFVTSADGTPIAFDRAGSGPAVILVVGAFNDRLTGVPLGQRLESRYTVYTYDRRGRGDSGDTAPYTAGREVEDIAALIAEAGGSASVFGYSSGAALALLAAAGGLAIRRLALYDAPLAFDDARTKPGDLARDLAELVAAGRRGDAVELFQIKGVGMPEEMVVQLRDAPFRPALEKMAHTLVYEMTILDAMSLRIPLGAVPAPTLAIVCGKSPEWMHEVARAVAEAVPDGRYRCLDGQDHTYAPEVLGPMLAEFYAS